MIEQYVEKLTIRSKEFYRENFDLEDKQKNLAQIDFLSDLRRELKLSKPDVPRNEKGTYKELLKVIDSGIKYYRSFIYD